MFSNTFNSCLRNLAKVKTIIERWLRVCKLFGIKSKTGCKIDANKESTKALFLTEKAILIINCIVSIPAQVSKGFIRGTKFNNA